MKTKNKLNVLNFKYIFFTILVLFALLINNKSNACTGICLTANDGTVVYGRTLEWGAFDLDSRVTIFPRGYEFTGLTPDGYSGKK
ncbi:MAG: linear amide C-N hydrolase [Ignavibacteria bacterium]|nr:linear amide C-N hydrolase [Ignavibacteria bacterium]